MHKYRLYEINQDGTKSDTGKVVVADSPTVNEWNEVERGNTLLDELMKVYGFNNFINPYYRACTTNRKGIRAEPGSFYVYGTCYHGGSIDLWYLKKGE